MKSTTIVRIFLRAWFAALLTGAQVAAAAQGDCGQPSSSGTAPSASDALAILRAAVGQTECALCVCDVNDSNSLTASDALVALKAAVGQPVLLVCPSCDSGVEKVIGSAGGTIESQDGLVTITFRAGALSEDTTISIVSRNLAGLPEPLGAIEDPGARAYAIGPDGLELDLPADVRVTLDEHPLATPGTFGAHIGVLMTAANDVAGLLDEQGTFLDGDALTVVATGEMSELSALVVVPTQIEVGVGGVPESLAVSAIAPLQASARDSDNVLTLTQASYVDTNFGAFKPVGGAVNQVLPQGDEGVYAGAFDYTCSGQANVYYRPQFELVFNVDVGSLHLSGVVQETTLQVTVLCGL